MYLQLDFQKIRKTKTNYFTIDSGLSKSIKSNALTVMAPSTRDTSDPIHYVIVARPTIVRSCDDYILY